MRHHYKLRLAQGGILDEQESEPLLVVVPVCRFRADLLAIPAAHGEVACLNAKSRHCRSGYLCEHALVKHSSIWPVSRPISPTRSPRRVSPAHATRKITRRRQENARDNAEGKGEREG